MPKPVPPRVVLACMRALLGRSDGLKTSEHEETRLEFRDLVVNPFNKEAWHHSDRIDLTNAKR